MHNEWKQGSLGKHRHAPRSEWGLLFLLHEESHVARSSEQTRSPGTTPTTWTEMAFSVAGGTRETWLTSRQWHHSLVGCGPRHVELWPTRSPTVGRVQRSQSTLTSQGSSVCGVPSSGHGCEAPGTEKAPWGESPENGAWDRDPDAQCIEGKLSKENSKGGREGAGPRKDVIKSSLSLDLNHGDLWSINYTAVLTLLGTWGWHFGNLGPFTDRSSHQISTLFSSSPPFCNRFPREWW